MLLAMLVAVRRRAAHPAVSPLAEPARAVTLAAAGDARASCVSSLLGPVLDGARPERQRHRSRAGPRARLRGRAARHAVRARCRRRCGSSTRSTRSATCAPTTSRARPPSTSASRSRSAAPWASPSPRTCSRCSCSTRLLTLVDLSAGRRTRATRRRSAPAASISLLLLGSSHAAVPAGDRRHLAACRHDSISRPGGILAGKAERSAAGSPACALRLRHRQGGGHAAALLAAGGHGRADAGQRAAARRRGRQGRRVHDPQGDRRRVRRRARWLRAAPATGSSGSRASR